MSTDAMQEQLFQDPIGSRLRQAREKVGLGIEQVGQQLKLPVAIVRAMEADDWSRLGAPVYVRSYLGSYLRLVGLPPELAEHAAQTKPAPQLVSMGAHSRMGHAFHRTLRNGIYLTLTAALVVPVVLVARLYQSPAAEQVVALDATPAQPPTREPGPREAARPEAPTPSRQAATSSESPSPVMASMAPFKKADAAAPEGLLLHFNDASWLEVMDPRGERIERALVEAGAERRYAPGQVAHITLGRADAVDVSFAGRDVDLSPYRAANVARFTVSSTGEPAPAGN